MNTGEERFLRAVIIDDESLARSRLRAMLRRIEGIEIVGEASDGDAGLALITREEPDVVFLDIKMPGSNGFNLLSGLGAENTPVVIFVTAFNNYAVRAFDTDAVDYLLKPVSFERLEGALVRARTALLSRDAAARLAEMERVIEALRTPSAEPQPSPYEREFWVQRRAEHLRVPVMKIEWIEADRDYVRLHVGGEAYLTRDTITSLSERLDPAWFMRVHRSAIVRRDLIQAIRPGPYGAIRVRLTTGTEVAVGRTFTKAVKREFLSKSPEKAAIAAE